TASTLTAGSRALARGAARAATGAIVSLRTTPDASNVEIQLSSTTPFLPRGELLELELGGIVSSSSRRPGGGLGTVTFTVEKALFDALPNGHAARVRYAGGGGVV